MITNKETAFSNNVVFLFFSNHYLRLAQALQYYLSVPHQNLLKYN